MRNRKLRSSRRVNKRRLRERRAEGAWDRKEEFQEIVQDFIEQEDIPVRLIADEYSVYKLKEVYRVDIVDLDIIGNPCVVEVEFVYDPEYYDNTVKAFFAVFADDKRVRNGLAEIEFDGNDVWSDIRWDSPL